MSGIPVQDEFNPMGDYFLIRGKYIDVEGVRLDKVINQVKDDISKIKTDSYTKQQADDKFAAKTDVYTKSEVDTALSGMYSNSEIDTKIDKVVVTKESEVADTTKIIFKESEQEIEVPTMEDLKEYQKIISGDTSERPNGAQVGFCYFDITLNKPVWKSASGWVDASGAEA